MHRPKIGAFIDPMSMDDTGERAKFLEHQGFHSVWLSDETIVFNSPPELVVPDVFPALTVAAASTKRVKIGTGVLDASIRHPAKTAQSVATVDAYSGGRMLAGIGGGEVGNHELFDIPFDHPFGRLEETVQVMKLLFSATHRKPVSFSGRFYSLDGAYLKIRPASRPGPPIIVSAFGPNALRLAGERGDGWLSFSHTPKSYSTVLGGAVAAAAARVGRDLRGFESTCVIPIALSRRAGEAAKKAALIAKDWLVWSPDNMKLLLPEMEPPRRRQPQAKSNRPEAVRELAALAARIPDDVALETTAHGTAEQCTEQLARFGRAGCRNIILYFVAVEKGWTETVREFSRRVLPSFAG